MLHVSRQCGGGRREHGQGPLEDLRGAAQRLECGRIKREPVLQPSATDGERGLLYVGTGKSYEVPASVKACAKVNPKADCDAWTSRLFSLTLTLP